MKVEGDNLVSVVIPTYNRSDILPRAVRSVLNQTYDNIEVIIVNDKSQDNTAQVIKRLEEKDSRVKGVENPKPYRLKDGNNPRNYALSLAEGKYCAFLDDDDEWHRQKLELQIECAEDASIIGAKTFAIRNEMGAKYANTLKNKNIQDLSFYDIALQDILRGGKYHISPSSLFTKTKYLKKVGGCDSSLSGSVGRDLDIKLVNRFGSGKIVDHKLVYFHHEENISKDSESEEQFKGVKECFERYKHMMSRDTRRERKFSIVRSHVFNHPSVKVRLEYSLKLLEYLDKLFPWTKDRIAKRMRVLWNYLKRNRISLIDEDEREAI